MTFLKITGILLQFLHALVSVLKLYGTKLQCFYSILTVLDHLDQCHLLILFEILSENIF